MIQLSGICTRCDLVREVEVTQESLDAYKAGELVQVAFPELSPADRELLFISHICGTCWNSLIKFNFDED